MSDICSNCSGKLEAKAKFCKFCGHPVSSEYVAPVSQASKPSPVEKTEEAIKEAPPVEKLDKTEKREGPAKKVKQVPAKKEKYDSPSSPKRKGFPKALLGLLILLLIGGGALIFSKSGPKLEVLSFYPESGSRGEFVYLEFNQDLDESQMELFYGKTPIQGYRITENVVAANVPLDAKSDNFIIKHKKRKAKAAFTVEEERLVELSREILSPSSKMQTIESEDGIAISLPGSFLDGEKTLTVHRVDNPAVLVDNPYGLPTVYDISIEGMEDLPENIEIGMKYDPDWFGEGEKVEDYLEPRRWDEEGQVWVDLYYRVDEASQTVYFLTDHLSKFSYFLTGFKWSGLAKTAAFIGVSSYALEYVANDVYISSKDNFRILYSDKGVRKLFPDDDWLQVTEGKWKTTSKKNPDAPAMMNTVGNILEESFKAYMDAGFEDPTRNWYGSLIYRRRVKVKVDSYYNIYMKGGEFSYNAFWDQINIANDVIKHDVFIPVKNHQDNHEKAMIALTQNLAHELFHAIQRQYYGYLTDYKKGKHMWWMEACAEYAANDVAWKRTSTFLNDRIANGFFAHSLNTSGTKADSYVKFADNDYEYLSAIFIRYLVQGVGYNFKDLVTYIGATGWEDEPVSSLGSYIVKESSANFALFYQDFLIWMLANNDLDMADFNNPDNKNVIAAKSQTISIPVPKVSLVLEKEENQMDIVSVYRELEGAAGGRSYYELVDIIFQSGSKIEVEAEAGDSLYFIATNGGENERNVKINMGLKTEDLEIDKIADYSLTVNKYGSAQVWAVKFEVGSWSIDPDEIEAGQVDKEYFFTIKGEDISKEIRNISIEYDFGDGRKDSKGTASGRVDSKGNVEIEISHSYEFPEKLDSEEKLSYPLKVKIMTGDTIISYLSAPVEINPLVLTILPPRIVTYEMLPGAKEVDHTFEASVLPEGDYIFEWDFGDGSKIEKSQGSKSIISHTFKQMGSWHPRVTLYSLEGDKLAEDSITIILEEGTKMEGEGLLYSESAGNTFKELDAAYSSGKNIPMTPYLMMKNGPIPIDASGNISYVDGHPVRVYRNDYDEQMTEGPWEIKMTGKIDLQKLKNLPNDGKRHKIGEGHYYHSVERFSRSLYDNEYFKDGRFHKEQAERYRRVQEVIDDDTSIFALKDDKGEIRIFIFGLYDDNFSHIYGRLTGISRETLNGETREEKIDDKVTLSSLLIFTLVDK